MIQEGNGHWKVIDCKKLSLSQLIKRMESGKKNLDDEQTEMARRDIKYKWITDTKLEILESD